jgi:hypothetical protein
MKSTLKFVRLISLLFRNGNVQKVRIAQSVYRRARAERPVEVKVKGKVTLRLTVSSPNLGLLTRFFFSKLLSCLFGASSLTRSRVCHVCVSVFVIQVYRDSVRGTWCRVPTQPPLQWVAGSAFPAV